LHSVGAFYGRGPQADRGFSPPFVVSEPEAYFSPNSWFAQWVATAIYTAPAAPFFLDLVFSFKLEQPLQLFRCKAHVDWVNRPAAFFRVTSPLGWRTALGYFGNQQRDCRILDVARLFPRLDEVVFAGQFFIFFSRLCSEVALVFPQARGRLIFEKTY